jgi:phosphoadenosine phosphosulfate reductase
MKEKSIYQKIDSSEKLIQRVLSENKNPVVACSFGKNSMVVLHLVKKFFSDVPVLFNDTLMEYPETYIYKKKITKEWNLKVINTKPIKSFWWVVENYGFPLFSRKGHRDASKNCCRYLKEYPIDKMLREYKWDLYFTGLSRHESRLREFSARKYGNYFYSKRSNHWKCHPIQDWTNEDVWGYHKIFKIPSNPFYEKSVPQGFELRTGCWCCTIPIKYGKIEFLRRHYPMLWRILLKKGLGQVLLQRKLGLDVGEERLEQLMEIRPCLFDKY